jgi:transposase
MLLEQYAAFVTIEETGDRLINEQQQNLLELRSIERSLEAQLHANQCQAHTSSGKAKSYLSQQVEFTKRQLTGIRQDIEQVIAEEPKLRNKSKLLISYKGIGKKTASILLIELPELGKLTGKEIANLVEVAPKTNQSGKKAGKAHITGGRFFVRKALFMAALTAAKYNDKMKLFYQRLRVILL